MAKLELFWDVVSPYTYLAFTQLDGLKQRTGAEIVLRPFLLGGVFKTAGNSSPLDHPLKARYLVNDIARWRDHYDVAMRLPGEVTFPILTVLPMRAAIAAQRLGQGDAFAKAIMNRYWQKGEDASQPDVISNAARDAGLDPVAVLDSAASQPIKDALRQSSDEAVSRGAFGAPAMFIGEELFWGNDRLPFVERRLLQLRDRAAASR